MLILSKYLYLLSVVLFVQGLKKLSHPESAKRGNTLAILGMSLSIITTLVMPLGEGDDNYMWIAASMVVGGSIGYLIAQRVALTKMPEMVSMLNGLGGACSMLIAILEMHKYTHTGVGSGGVLTMILVALFIGSVSFTGSLVAYGKLDGMLRDNIKLPFPQVVNSLLLVACIAVAVMIGIQGADTSIGLFMLMVGLSVLYGITFVLPIGGGDMPVVISLLNSFTGLAAAGAGLIYTNYVMIVGGILVGASGVFLTVLMCAAMNRSLLNVIIGNFGGGGSTATGREEVVKEVSITDLAIQLKYGQKVIIVPGYGMAVAQAQHTCKELENILDAEGVAVKYAIHPVAGRMPGHMNVLLAEADIAYDKLLELEEANKEFATTDVVLIIGANDVVNPAAKEDSSSPIYGMPILEVEEAKAIVVLKRSMGVGYAGIQNQLFFGERTKMLFGDAKSSMNKLKDEVDSV